MSNKTNIIRLLIILHLLYILPIVSQNFRTHWYKNLGIYTYVDNIAVHPNGVKIIKLKPGIHPFIKSY